MRCSRNLNKFNLSRAKDTMKTTKTVEHRTFRLIALVCSIILFFHQKADAAFVSQGPSTNGLSTMAQQQQVLSIHSKPNKQLLASTATTQTKENLDEQPLQVLYQAVGETTKSSKPDDDYLINALRNLETQQRQLAKQQDDTLSETLRTNLAGDWQLMLVTDKRLKSVIYLPVRNIFSIRRSSNDDEPFQVENAIRVGQDWVLLSFLGTMEYNARKRQGLFDYNRFTLFNGAIDIGLKPGEAERMVSTVEKRATPKTKKPLFGAYEKQSSTKPFFNFFVANDQVAAARGSVGGFALWKRVK